jgi:ribosome recycling factor
MSLQGAYDCFAEGKEEALEWFRGELTGIRTGRVKPELVDSLPVEYYGTRNPLKGLASISNTDARTLVISPWDPSAVSAIEKTITEVNLGAMPIVDGKIIRLSFPTQTEEAREQTVKMLHKKAEEARIRLRQARDEAMKILKDEKESSAITEDDFYEGREKLDEMIDAANDEIKDWVEKKEEEVRTI